jgi:hypothetical protein
VCQPPPPPAAAGYCPKKNYTYRALHPWSGCQHLKSGAQCALQWAALGAPVETTTAPRGGGLTLLTTAHHCPVQPLCAPQGLGCRHPRATPCTVSPYSTCGEGVPAPAGAGTPHLMCQPPRGAAHRGVRPPRVTQPFSLGHNTTPLMVFWGDASTQHCCMRVFSLAVQDAWQTPTGLHFEAWGKTVEGATEKCSGNRGKQVWGTRHTPLGADTQWGPPHRHGVQAPSVQKRPGPAFQSP